MSWTTNDVKNYKSSASSGGGWTVDDIRQQEERQRQKEEEQRRLQEQQRQEAERQQQEAAQQKQIMDSIKSSSYTPTVDDIMKTVGGNTTPTAPSVLPTQTMPSVKGAAKPRTESQPTADYNNLSWFGKLKQNYWNKYLDNKDKQAQFEQDQKKYLKDPNGSTWDPNNRKTQLELANEGLVSKNDPIVKAEQWQEDNINKPVKNFAMQHGGEFKVPEQEVAYKDDSGNVQYGVTKREKIDTDGTPYYVLQNQFGDEISIQKDRLINDVNKLTPEESQQLVNNVNLEKQQRAQDIAQRQQDFSKKPLLSRVSDKLASVMKKTIFGVDNESPNYKGLSDAEMSTGYKWLDAATNLGGTVAGFTTPIGAEGSLMNGMGNVSENAAMRVGANLETKSPFLQKVIDRAVRGGTTMAQIGAYEGAVQGKDPQEIAKEAVLYGAAGAVGGAAGVAMPPAVSNTLEKSALGRAVLRGHQGGATFAALDAAGTAQQGGTAKQVAENAAYGYLTGFLFDNVMSGIEKGPAYVKGAYDYAKNAPAGDPQYNEYMAAQYNLIKNAGQYNGMQTVRDSIDRMIEATDANIKFTSNQVKLPKRTDEFKLYQQQLRANKNVLVDLRKQVDEFNKTNTDETPVDIQSLLNNKNIMPQTDQQTNGVGADTLQPSEVKSNIGSNKGQNDVWTVDDVKNYNQVAQVASAAPETQPTNMAALKGYGNVEIVNNTDPAQVTIKNDKGTQITIGRHAFDNLKINDIAPSGTPAAQVQPQMTPADTINVNQDTKQPESGIIKEKTPAEVSVMSPKSDLSPASQIAGGLENHLKTDTKISADTLFKLADKAHNGTMAEGKYSVKDAYDALELAVNKHIMENRLVNPATKTAVNAAADVEKLQKLLNLLPTQTKRTTEMEQFQQFSTPPSIAYLANWVANITPKDVMLEPSAGIGGLATFAKMAGAEVVVNELSPRRLEILKQLPFDEFYNENAEHIDSILPKDIKPTVVVMNPPFSATAGRMGNKNDTSNAKLHLQQALNRLEPNGRLVAIVGQGMADSSPTFKGWWNELRQKYTIQANVGIEGKNYTKYGTSFDIQLVVIDKTGPQEEAKTVTGKYADITEIPKILEGIRNARQEVIQTTKRTKPSTAQPSSKELPTEGKGGNISQRPVRNAANEVGTSKNPDNTRGEKLPSGKTTGGNAGNGTIPTNEDVAKPSNDNTKAVEAGKDTTGSSSTIDRPANDLNGNVETGVKLETQKNQSKVKDLGESVYTEYVPQKLKIAGAKSHPGTLSQSAAMGAVEPPDPTYTPNLPKEVIDKGKLSIAQLESVVYAGQAHQQILPNGNRRGFFIGDGTGVGKGREISGIIMDNMRQGRKKAVWISINGSLLEDAKRDWSGIGGDPTQIKDFSNTKLGDKIPYDEGILFVTYGTLGQNFSSQGDIKNGKQKIARLPQILEWLGQNFDGVIAFDEAHKMQNGISIKGARGVKKPSQTALAGIDLQDKAPNARVVYVSATGATEVSNLAYTERLGLWGRGTSFANKEDFVNKIQKGGLAAMELVARDMKSMGAYIARSLSYDGVDYNTLEHKLTSEQTQMYDTLAKGWQVVLQNMTEALKVTGADKDGNAKGRAASQFWGSQQRFFNQVLTAMQMPSVIADIKTRLANGEAIVLQLTNTNEASQNRAMANLEESGGTLEDLDLTPRDILMQFIENSFPTTQFELYVDDNGNTKSRPVYDSKGNAVINREAERMKDELLNKLGSIKVPEGPLEMLLNTFGPDKVAEATGRSRRVIRVTDTNTGKTKTIAEPRGPRHVAVDVDQFQGGKKDILVFSEAGGTGKSYHADLTKPNQKHRTHYLVQAGWRADSAVQGFGRTHRTNQASAPTYVLVTTNLKGHKRFISSIARRLDQLGALTKGQRQTGSQGLFSAKDNLESELARDTLQAFYKALQKDKVPNLFSETLNGDNLIVLEKMGLKEKLFDEHGYPKDDADTMRDITKFLNRLLVLEPDVQNNMFNAFMERYEDATDRAAQSGTLDTGLENYKAERVDIADEKVIREDASSGAETKYYGLKAYHKNIKVGFKDIPTGSQDFLGFYHNSKSGSIRAVFKGVDRTDDYGRVEKMVKLMGQTTGYDRVAQSKIDNGNYEKVIDLTEAKKLWDAAIDKVPELKEEKLNLISGALLPVWDRLPDNQMRVIRVLTSDGQVLLGRLIGEREIDHTLQKLGSERTKEKLNGAKIAKQILDENYRAYLSNGWRLERRRVSGEDRIEIAGNDLYQHYSELEQDGAFTERIQYSTRFFIPKGEKAAGVIEKITKYRPVSSMEAPDNGAVGFSSANGGSKLRTATGTNKNVKGTKRASEIKTDMIDRLNMVVKKGGIRSKQILGNFNPRTFITRLRKANDIPTLAHEAGHQLDEIYNLSSISHKEELTKLGDNTSKPSYSPKRKRQEGVAEFVRLYLTDRASAQAEAPKFFNYFESTVEPEITRVLEEFAQNIDKLINLSAAERVGKTIHFKGDKTVKEPLEIKRKLREIYAGVVDASYPVEWAAGELGGKSEAQKMFNKLSSLRGFEGISLFDINPDSKDGWYQTDLTGNPIGPSYSEIREGIDKNEQIRRDFEKYRVSRRAADYETRGLELPEDMAIYKQAAKELEAQYPFFKDKFEQTKKYSHNLATLLVESGIYDYEKLKEIEEANPNYVSLKRIMDTFENVATGSSNKLGGSKRVIKKLKGGGEDIMDPEESDITNTFIYRSVALRNRVLADLADLADKAKGKGAIMVKSPVKIKATSFNIENVKKALNDAGIDTQGLNLDIMATLFMPNYLAGPNQVIVYRKGKPELYDVDPDLYGAVTALQPNQASVLTKVMMFAATLQKTGIIFTPKYIAYNLGRDFFHSLVASESGINPIDIMRGFVSSFSNDEWNKQAHIRGGTTNFFTANDRKFAQEAIDDIMAGHSKAKRLTERIKHPLVSIQRLLHPFELGPRMAEMKKTMGQIAKAGGPIDEKAWNEAVKNMRDQSVDFRRMGAWVKRFQLNRIFNFVNSQIQGQDKFYRLIINPKTRMRTILRGLMYITIPTILLWLLEKDNENYQQLPWYRKDLFWNIPIGDPKTAQYFLPIPRPFELGIFFGALPLRMLEKFSQDNPDGFKEFATSLWQSFGVDAVPTALQGIAQDWKGKKWNGVPILSYSDSQVSPELQYNDYTSEFSKGVANVSAKLPDWATPDMVKSPKRLDNFLRTQFGTMGDVALQTGDQIAGKKDGIPVVGGLVKNFVVDSQQNPQSVADFYDYKSKVDQMYNNYRKTGEYSNDNYSPYIKKRFTAAAAQISKLQDDIAYYQGNEPDIGKRNLLIAGSKKEMVDLAKDMNQLYKDTFYSK